jgi:hypothetical protein
LADPAGRLHPGRHHRHRGAPASLVIQPPAAIPSRTMREEMSRWSAFRLSRPA